MTEQEVRENAIYKMVIVAYDHILKSKSYYDIVKDIRCGRYSEFEKLYDAGYRKDGEVINKTLERLCHEYGDALKAYKDTREDRTISDVFGIFLQIVNEEFVEEE